MYTYVIWPLQLNTLRAGTFTIFSEHLVIARKEVWDENEVWSTEEWTYARDRRRSILCLLAMLLHSRDLETS